MQLIVFKIAIPGWHRDANQLKFEVADHQVSGLGSCKERRSAIETRICLNER